MSPEEAKAALTKGPKPASAVVEGEPKASETLFHNQHPGSSFVMPDGSILVFDAKGELRTTDPRAIKELEAIADKPGCPVYFKNKAATPAPGDKEAALDNRKAAEAVLDQLRAQQAAGKPQ